MNMVKVIITEGMNVVLRPSGHTEFKAWNVEFLIRSEMNLEQAYSLLVNRDEFSKEEEIEMDLEEAREVWLALVNKCDTIEI